MKRSGVQCDYPDGIPDSQPQWLDVSPIQYRRAVLHINDGFTFGEIAEGDGVSRKQVERGVHHVIFVLRRGPVPRGGVIQRLRNAGISPEETATMDDEELLSLRNIGPSTLSEIRRFYPRVKPDPIGY